MSTIETTTLVAQLRAVLELTNTEIQVALTRVAQARTDAVRRELVQNADNARERAEAVESAIWRSSTNCSTAPVTSRHSPSPVAMPTSRCSRPD